MKSLALMLLLVSSGLASKPADGSSSPGRVDPASRWPADVQTGVLWQFGGNTSIDYVLLPQVISIRTPEHLQFGIGAGELTVRARFSLLAEAGLRWHVRPNLAVSASAFFQHMSNGGATDPNPGIDAVGPMLGLTWHF